MRRELEIQAYVWNATTGGEGGVSGCRSLIENLERDGVVGKMIVLVLGEGEREVGVRLGLWEI